LVKPRTILRRLFEYATPYRARLGWATLGMVVYAVGSAGLAYLIKPIFDSVLPKQQDVGRIAWAIVGVYLLKGIGSYVSSYLMADVGQRVVTDLRNALYRHILDQSAGFFAHGATGRLLSRINNDVGQVQQAVSETAGDLARESLALVGYAALLFYYDARLTIVCLTGAPLIVYPLIRLGQRRAPDDAAQPGSARASLASQPKRSPVIGSSRRSAPKRMKPRSSRVPATACSARNMKVTAALSSLPPLMELIGGIAMAAAIVYGSQQIASGRLTPGQFTLFIRDAVSHVRPREETQPRQREPAAGDCGIGAHLRDDGHAHRGPGTGRCAHPRAVSRSDRVP